MGSKRKKGVQNGHVSGAAGGMKKWYVVIGVLAILLVLSASMWLVNSVEVGRYKAELVDTRAQYDAEVQSLWSRLIAVQGELAITKNDLADVTSELDTVRAANE